MSFAQWVLHYKEISKYNKLKDELEKSKFSFYKAMVDRLCNRLEFVAYMIDPEMAKSALQDDANRAVENVQDKEEKLMEDFEELTRTMPETITLDMTQEKFFLPKVKRKKPGIFMGGGE